MPLVADHAPHAGHGGLHAKVQRIVHTGFLGHHLRAQPCGAGNAAEMQLLQLHHQPPIGLMQHKGQPRGPQVFHHPACGFAQGGLHGLGGKAAGPHLGIGARLQIEGDRPLHRALGRAQGPGQHTARPGGGRLDLHLAHQPVRARKAMKPRECGRQPLVGGAQGTLVQRQGEHGAKRGGMDDPGQSIASHPSHRPQAAKKKADSRRPSCTNTRPVRI